MNKKKVIIRSDDTDSLIRPADALFIASLEYETKSVAELEQLLQSKIALEEYEHCALIRAELIRRNSYFRQDGCLSRLQKEDFFRRHGLFKSSEKFQEKAIFRNLN